MANGWKNFELNGSAAPSNWPKRAILDGRETVFEARPGNSAGSTEYRRVATAQFHVNCNSDSASNDAVTTTLSTMSVLSNPVVQIGLTDGRVSNLTLRPPLGSTWQVERITETHNGDGTCVFRFSLVYREEWPTS